MNDINILGITLTLRAMVVILAALSFLGYIWFINKRILSSKNRQLATIITIMVVGSLFFMGFFAIGFNCDTVSCAAGFEKVATQSSLQGYELCECRPSTSCGNGVCSNGETQFSCPLDCKTPSGSTPYCGDGTCDSGEGYYTCPGDCEPPTTPARLSDGSYCSSKSVCLGKFCVHSRCRSTATYCGDGACDTGETTGSCPRDCPAPLDNTNETSSSGCNTIACDDVSGYNVVCTDGGCVYTLKTTAVQNTSITPTNKTKTTTTTADDQGLWDGLFLVIVLVFVLIVMVIVNKKLKKK